MICSRLSVIVALFPCVLVGASPGAGAADEPAAVKEADKEEAWDVATADLGPTRTLDYTVNEGTWTCLDVSPDGERIVFDLLGDLYLMPITGGEATLLRGGRQWDAQPRFSPDGEWISFTSDGGGGDNAWVMRADGSEARQVTKEDFRLVNNAVWTPDGRSLVVKKHFTSRRSLGAGEMWLYDVAHGGKGVQLTERPTDQKDVGEPEISPDGRWLYYSLDVSPGETFQYNKDPNTGIYAIRRVDLESGREETLSHAPGGSVRPEISPDGKTLAFVRRVRLKTALMLRDLESGDERLLFDGLSKDQQETWATFGVYPGFAWTPDGRSIVIEAQGGIARVDVQSGVVTPIPYTARVEQEVVDALRFRPELAGETFPVNVIRWPRVSPDGRHVVFQALGSLWTRHLDEPDGEAQRLTREDDLEFFPTWTPNGRHVVFTTWDDREGGRVKVVGAHGGRVRTLVSTPGHYAEPSVSADGKQVVYRRGRGDGVRGGHFATEPGIHVVPFRGGEPRRVTRRGTRPRFTAKDERLLLFEDGGEKNTLFSVDLLGGDRRNLVESERAMEIELSPDGRWVAFAEMWEVFVAPRPATGRVLAVGPKMTNLPVRRASLVSGEFLAWSQDSRELHYSLGSWLYRVEVARLFAPESEDAEKDRKARKRDPEHWAHDLGWQAAVDRPDTNLAFVNATVLTMDDAGVIENGVVHVVGNRIRAVGRAGEIDYGEARVIDVMGRVLLPGFIDIHAHTGSSNLGTHAEVNWKYLANLAFGVTTTHDPSNNTKMIFASSELVKAGRILGPRITSTGTILYGAEGDFKAKTESLDDARRHLSRLKAWGAFSAKSYNQPRREQRQWYVKAGRELEMMIVPEGGSFLAHDLSMILDGHTTVEHAMPVAPLRDDALTLFASSDTAYTPTLGVGYGGLGGEYWWYQHDDVWRNERLMRFVPRNSVDPRARRRLKAPEEDFHHLLLAASAVEVERRGGNIQVGGHGQVQGLAAHWEMWMFGQGGLEPMEVLRTGTINGAEALGFDDQLGSITAGKLADLLVLDGDPRQDLRQTENVGLVMINGRLFDARTLAQLQPEAKAPPQGPDLNAIPHEHWDAGCGPH
jgi:Tol biopolymer transport system component/imidazolonepropionase-like amidohydrolase